LAVNVMAEGNETPNGEQGSGPEGRPRRSEGDLLAERRARRAAESGEVALTRRAEAAEATVQTLERHVASLQQRLRETEDERLRTDELLDAEREAALEREHELRRVKQREYAEQQLRVESEERLAHVSDEYARLERDSREEIDRLSASLGASEESARGLVRRLEGLQRQLAEAEQALSAERAQARTDARSGAEQDLQERLTELERRALEIQRGLDTERTARERSELLLASMREGHSRMESLLGEMKGIVARVTGAIAAQERPAIAPLGAVGVPTEVRGSEMADALAAAVERLRARAEAVPADGEAVPADDETVSASIEAAAAPPVRAQALQGPRPVFRESAPQAPVHRHSLSWFARRRIKRKQRRGL
jgi:chromosome segregation ATPase